MIDLIINEHGGVTLAHTLRALDGYDAIEVARADGAATLRGPAGERPLGALRPAMIEMLRPGMRGRAVRVSGWAVARVSPLAVRVH